MSSHTTCSKLPYKGTRDLFPKEKRTLDYLYSVMKKTALSFGYETYDGPILEDLDLYKAKSGEEIVGEQLYSFVDRGEREVAIRPEMTPTVARMVAQIYREVAMPIRWFSFPNLMRYENPQRGRLREHWQFNCDIFGASEEFSILEILQLLIALMKNYGADENHFSLLINNRKIVDALCGKILKINSEVTHKLYKLIDRAKKISPTELEKSINELIGGQNQKEFLALKEYFELKTFDSVLEWLKKNHLLAEYDLITNFYQKLKNLGIESFILFDPCIVRGLDYYTGFVFEIFDKNPSNPRAICGGGAYANLLQIFGENSLPAVGLGLGDVTLTHFLQGHNLLPDFSQDPVDLWLTFQDERAEDHLMKLGLELRLKNIRVMVHPSEIKLKKLFPSAEKKLVKVVGFMGEDEVEAQTIQLKNLQSKEQNSFSLNAIDSIVSFLK